MLEISFHFVTLPTIGLAFCIQQQHTTWKWCDSLELDAYAINENLLLNQPIGDVPTAAHINFTVMRIFFCLALYRIQAQYVPVPGVCVCVCRVHVTWDNRIFCSNICTKQFSSNIVDHVMSVDTQYSYTYTLYVHLHCTVTKNLDDKNSLLRGCWITCNAMKWYYLSCSHAWTLDVDI